MKGKSVLTYGIWTCGHVALKAENLHCLESSSYDGEMDVWRTEGSKCEFVVFWVYRVWQMWWGMADWGGLDIWNIKVWMIWCQPVEMYVVMAGGEMCMGK